MKGVFMTEEFFSEFHIFDDSRFSGMDLNTVLDLNLNLMGWPGRFACRLDNLQVLSANLVFAALCALLV
jgi:hypothetical protein